MKKLILLAVLSMTMMFSGCKIVQITQPASADKNSEITVSLSILANDVPEPNAHKGVVGILLPRDWQVLSATYRCALGSGILSPSDAWTDSLVTCYPPGDFEGDMKWIALVSDQGYAHETPVTVDVDLRLLTGNAEGCFKLGYLVSKATSGLICAGVDSWAPFSYPNKVAVPLGTTCDENFKVERAEDWNDLLNRKSGWTGADGIYSIPMDGCEQPQGQDHLLLFSDTFLGQVDAAGKRINSTLVNNTLAYLRGNKPTADSISFMWDQSGAGARAVFTPATPSAGAKDFYWLMDGVKIDSIIHVFALRLNITGGGAFDFNLNGVVLLSFKLDDDRHPALVQQQDLPFFKNEGGVSVVFGQAIMPHARASGNKHQDGYIYIYGPRDDGSGKKLVAARVLPENFLDFSQWRFWNGAEWGEAFNACAGITDRISQEFSVSEMGDQYVLVAQAGSSVIVRFGETPVGPFGFYSEIYQCPEANISSNVFIYNAKAHPSLSDDNSLLISYNVNTLNFAENINIADIYRPRFIRFSLLENSSGIKEKTNMPCAFRLLQNYPNPFNPVTQISFELLKKSEVTLRIYNALGQVVETLLHQQTFAPGLYTTRWQPQDQSSGVFFYTLESPGWHEIKKMVLIR